MVNECHQHWCPLCSLSVTQRYMSGHVRILPEHWNFSWRCRLWELSVVYCCRYQGYISAALVLGGVDPTGPHLYTVHPHGSTDSLPYVTMGTQCFISARISAWHHLIYLLCLNPSALQSTTSEKFVMIVWRLWQLFKKMLRVHHCFTANLFNIFLAHHSFSVLKYWIRILLSLLM